MPSHNTWISHNGLPQPFLGHFIVEIAHAKEPIRFYVFEDTSTVSLASCIKVRTAVGPHEY